MTDGVLPQPTDELAAIRSPYGIGNDVRLLISGLVTYLNLAELLWRDAFFIPNSSQGQQTSIGFGASQNGQGNIGPGTLELDGASYTTSNVTSNQAYWDSGPLFRRDQQLIFSCQARLAQTTAIRVWIGLCSSTHANMNSDDPVATSLAAFRYSTDAGDTTWRCCTKDGTTLMNVDSGIAIGTTIKNFQIAFSADGNTITFLINSVIVATITTNLPSVSADLRTGWVIETRTTVAKRLDGYYARMRSRVI